MSAGQADDKYVTSKQVRDELGGVSDMTLWRWENDENMGFPKPIRINRRRYWRAAEISQFMASRAAVGQEG